MFIYCDNCEYDSGDFDFRQEVIDQVKGAGGSWEDNECPDCDDGDLHLD